MLAAVDDVHHRRGQQAGVRAADVSIQRQLAIAGGGVGRRQRYAEDRIGAEILFVRRAIELDHPLVDGDLVERIHAHKLVSDFFVDVVDGFQHALAQKVRLVAVAQLPGLMHTGAGAAGNGGRANRVIVQSYIDLDGRIAAAIENLPGVDIDNHAHGFGLLRRKFEVRQPARHFRL